MSASIILVDIGEDLKGREESGVFLHQVIVQLDVGLVLHYGALSIQLLTVLGDEPVKQQPLPPVFHPQLS